MLVPQTGEKIVEANLPPRSNKGKNAAIVVTVMGVTAAVIGIIAVVSIYAFPHASIGEWFKPMGSYSFILLGGSGLIILIASIGVCRLNKKSIKPLATHANWSRMITYAPNGDKDKCNLDRSYADPTKGFAIVLDGVEHNREDKGPPIEGEFNKLIHAYQPITEASSTEEASNAIEKQLFSFANDKKNYEHTQGAAVSFCQIVRIEGKKHLFLFQWADTRILIQKANGEIDWLDGFYKQKIDQAGFGFNYSIGHFPIEEGDTVIGFSDGIGDYMSKEMFTDELNKESNRSLLERLVSEQIKKNETHTTETAINGKNIKSHEAKGDDVSLFVLKV